MAFSNPDRRSGLRRIRPSGVGLGCGRKCGQDCGRRVRTQRGSRPRWHWRLARFPSPTTRPPRREVEKGERVVGLVSLCNAKPAGAGPQKTAQTEKRVSSQEQYRVSISSQVGGVQDER
jgi:hypothetical protein